MSSKFPRIDILELHRLRDAAQIPAKKSKDANALGAWRIAKRMKEHEATAKIKAKAKATGIHVEETDISKTREWANVVEYLTAAVAKGDFSILDEFATAWNSWQIVPDIIAADFPTGLTIHSGESVTNKKSRPVRIAVIESIMRLQRAHDSPDRAPSFQEIQVDLQDHIAIDETELSRQLKAIGLQKRIPHEEDLR